MSKRPRPKFMQFCPNFQQIKIFGDVFGPLYPSSYTSG